MTEYVSGIENSEKKQKDFLDRLELECFGVLTSVDFIDASKGVPSLLHFLFSTFLSYPDSKPSRTLNMQEFTKISHSVMGIELKLKNFQGEKPQGLQLYELLLPEFKEISDIIRNKVLETGTI
jgi:hypothetical protein